MKFVLTVFCAFASILTWAQDREEYFDMSFHPNKNAPFYFVSTKKTDSGWVQEAYYLSNLMMASKCTFKDESCKMPEGDYISFDIDGHVKQTGTFRDGKREGAWMVYNKNGFIVDSGVYVNNHMKGVRMLWHDNGMARDSMNFDGAGNGVEVSWYDDGRFASGGYWTQETSKRGRWKYFYKDGTLKATEDYVNGKVSICNCYTEKGEAIDTALCKEREATPTGGINEWSKFIQKNLMQLVIYLANNGVKPGSYTVVIKFVVLEDGSLSEFEPLTRFGHGIEEQVVKVLRSAPKWEPGRLFGRAVKSYHTQPVTFMIQQP